MTLRLQIVGPRVERFVPAAVVASHEHRGGAGHSTAAAVVVIVVAATAVAADAEPVVQEAVEVGHEVLLSLSHGVPHLGPLAALGPEEAVVAVAAVAVARILNLGL